MERGQRAKALHLAQARLDAPDASPALREAAHVTEVLALLELRRWTELRDAMDRLDDANVNLGNYGTHLQALLATAEGNCSRAADIVLSLPEHSIFRPISWSRVAHCNLRQRDPTAADLALSAYEQEADADWQRAEALLLKGRSAELQGQGAAAKEHYRQVLIHHPFTNASVSARERLADKDKQIWGEDLLPRAEAERSRQRKLSARRTYLQILRAGAAKKSRHLRDLALLGLAELEIIGYQYTRALNRLTEVVLNGETPELRARALFLQGDVLSRRGRVDECLAAYQRAVDEFPSTPHALESALSAARIAYSKRRYGVAKRFARWLIDHPGSPAKGSVITEDGATVAGGGSSGTHQDQGRWLMAWIARRTQPGTSEAHEWLTDIGADSELFSGALYWQARFSLDRDDMLSAERLTATLMEHAPAHYYAHAATERLCRAGGTCLQVSRSYSGDRPGRRPDDLLGVVRIYDIGLRRSAFGLLKAIPSGGLLPVDRAYLAWLHGQASDLKRATWISRSVVAVPEFGSDPGVLSTAYPVAFADVVQREAERSGVPEALLLAVMREESGFNPKALSPRGARGLMQMIPSTARRMAVSAGVGGFALHRLYRPEVSIRLGAHYLRLLLKEFNGDLSAAIASYHAGEKTVARWKKDNEALSVDEFIEEIPYSSTRKYVKRVLGTYNTYRSLGRATSAGAL